MLTRGLFVSFLSARAVTNRESWPEDNLRSWEVVEHGEKSTGSFLVALALFSLSKERPLRPSRRSAVREVQRLKTNRLNYADCVGSAFVRHDGTFHQVLRTSCRSSST